MQKFFWSTCLAVCVCLAASNLQAQTPVQKGTVGGGVAGAIIGGIIGHQNDETAEGVAIGAALGALTGNVVGRKQEGNIIRQQQQQAEFFQQQQYQQQLAQESLNRAVSLDDAISLTRSGLSESLIVDQVLKNGVQQEIGVSEVIALHQNGVSEQVIRAMQSAQIGEPSIQPSYHYEQPVQVATPVVVQPVPRVVVAPAPRVIVQTKPVYRRPPHGPSYHRGRQPARYPSNRVGKYYGPQTGGSIRIGF